MQFGEQVCGTTEEDFYRYQSLDYDNVGTVVTYAWSRVPDFGSFDGRTTFWCRNSVSDCAMYVTSLCIDLVDRQTDREVQFDHKMLVVEEIARDD